MTERLYYSDSFLSRFEATVSRVIAGERPGVVLDRTAFYPTSGGQIFDTGLLLIDGERVPVLEVAEGENGEIVHWVEVSDNLQAGNRVQGEVDELRRRDHMQQHSGQHVLSAAFFSLFQIPTASFHMGDESCTIDLATPNISEDQFAKAEELANEVVFENRPVTIRFVGYEEAQELGLRKIPTLEKIASKTKSGVTESNEGLAGDHHRLRLIEIRDFDLNACGGTHVASTGQIGPILVRKSEKVKQGMRVEFVCGKRALLTAKRDYSVLTRAASLFSGHIWDVPQQAEKSLNHIKGLQKQEHRLLEELAEFWAEKLYVESSSLNGRKGIECLFEDRDLAFIRLLGQKLAKKPSCVALLGAGSGQASLVFSRSSDMAIDVSALMKEVLAGVGGRGGGSKDMAQGGVPDAAKLKELLELAVRKLGTT